MSIFGGGYGNNYNSNGGGFNWRLLIALGIAVVGVVSYLTHTSVNPITGEKQHLSMNAAQETQLGIASAPEMARQFGGDVDPNDPEAKEVRYVGNTLWRVSGAEEKMHYTSHQYHLLNDMHTVNAFALPGGQIFITKALYEALHDEAELAGVLGHETGHVIERHSAQQVEKGQLGQSLVTAVAVGSNHPLSSGMIANVVNQVTQLKFSRDDESQADSQGLKLMAAAKYDPRAMIGVMEVLMKASQGGRQPEFLVTHPYPESRIKAIKAELEERYHGNIPADLKAGGHCRGIETVETKANAKIRIISLGRIKRIHRRDAEARREERWIAVCPDPLCVPLRLCG